ncbi:hypothetical protein [Phenylobacterium sp.]|uniref:hypothetical protein n=1 Tax=Phenylobacterium sp. TaxID=1871053 RepID=UPI00286BB7B7|nr:hypothetical protein [Phenylobacterium sp.]
MTFDVRLPIGLLFLAIGALVAAYGLTADQAAMSAHSAGLNIDLVWGLVMAGFGAVMLVLVWLARKGDLPPPSEG